MRTVLDEGSILKTIADLASSKDIDKSSSVKDIAKVFYNRSKTPTDEKREFLGGSIAKYSKDLTMTFPALIDNSLTPETASMISKANERNIVSMLQMLFAAMQIPGTDGRDIIKRIYGDAGRLGNLSYDDYMNKLRKFGQEYGTSARAAKFFESSAITEDDMIEYAKKMEAELKRPMKCFPTDSFSDNSLNDYSVLNINGTEKVTFAPVKESETIDEAEKAWEPDEYGFVHRNLYAKDGSFGKPEIPTTDTADFHNKALNYAYNRQNQLAQQKLNTDKFAQQVTMDKLKVKQLRSQLNKDQSEILSRQLMDSDVKKANEMQPTMMIINFTEVDPNDEFKINDQRSFVAGVKSRLIPVSSSDILERIVAKNKTRINFLNFIRATTGEISFMKDFILCLKQAKIDAKNSIKHGPAAEMWKTLESLATKNNRNKLRQSGNDASAITTLVINQETANLIAKQYDINVENVNTARQIMNDYNLLGIIIADEAIEVIKFLYDGQDMFEQQAYSFLEKENNDKSYKKIINLMSQNRRF